MCLLSVITIRFAGVKKSLADFGITSGGGAAAKAEDNDDDFELFGSDDEVVFGVNVVSNEWM
jgi:hypothetical protein